MVLITGGTVGIGAAFARQHWVKALYSLDDAGERQAHRDRAPMAEAGAATLAIEMTARDEPRRRCCPRRRLLQPLR
jgi:short-subunit dehydrogenase involved in D-alanine esterification of teichoic acids